jgi:hypothetical protein
MNGENPSGADNQQERLDVSTWMDGIPMPLGHYVAGFLWFNRDTARILRGHTQSSLLTARMKIWSMPHGDMGKYMNYNRQT